MYDVYKGARNAAWKAILDCNIRCLPVNLMVISKHFDIDIVLYSQCGIIDAFRPEVLSGDGFIASMGGRKTIFLNDQKGTYGRRRFTLAHELGHGIQGHPLSQIHYRNSETDNPDDTRELAANVFARDLLAPACVLAAMNLHTPEEIMRACKISRQSAEIRAVRLDILYQRGMFGVHPLEKQVLCQFQEYVHNGYVEE